MYRFAVSFSLADDKAKQSFLDVLGSTGQLAQLDDNTFVLGQAQEQLAYIDLIQKEIVGWVKNHSAKKDDFITVMTPVVEFDEPFIMVENYI